MTLHPPPRLAAGSPLAARNPATTPPGNARIPMNDNNSANDG
jgi:hypothetical protein